MNIDQNYTIGTTGTCTRQVFYLNGYWRSKVKVNLGHINNSRCTCTEFQAKCGDTAFHVHMVILMHVAYNSSFNLLSLYSETFRYILVYFGCNYVLIKAAYSKFIFVHIVGIF